MKRVLGNDMQLGCTEFVHAYRAEAVLDIFKMSPFCCCIKSRIQRQNEKGPNPFSADVHFPPHCRQPNDNRYWTNLSFSDLSTCLCNPVFADAK